ncbi:MAG: Rne/Rng family ribonuclease, partial [Rickettsiales bacterium]|nr:Rne/Rng family ribonuclease [Rickettsiales bacterium]
MNNRLLVDAAFPEETRVVLLNEKNVLENIDRETTYIKQLKGNIYLAKIIRIEPSLQAAFINYGGDRHGFLPMSDIHPDYYNIPGDKKTDLSVVKFFTTEDKQYSLDNNAGKEKEEAIEASDEDFADESNMLKMDQNNEPILDDDNPEIIDTSDTEGESEDSNDENEEYSEKEIRYNNFKRYKIEDVLKEGQYLLVQVLKEERGNKGVALTTYLSIAGKYSVLMANIEGKGGISKKIINIRDRKILKNILNTLNPDNSKSIIIRTAGVGKKPEDIFRDYVYLMRLWAAIKQTVLESTAPTFIHSEDDILKRTIRDLYNDEVREIIVEGEKAYKTIKILTSIIMPEQETIIREHTEKLPLFHRYKIEDQVNQLYSNRIELPSGGSIVIDQTEALVTIDVNSGRATKEKSVEDMALATNIDAAKEIARQLRLRDIGGLIVIDFIDMFKSKNKRTIERVMRDETSVDKAKIQIDTISVFGLLEMSRQRINTSFGEKVSEKCHNCDGHGTVKSRYIVANNILRAIKYTVTKDKAVKIVNILTSDDIVNFMFNYKREAIGEVEKNYNIHVIFTIDKNKQDHNFEIIRRNELTAEERADLCPTQHIGRVNELFDDD